MATILLVIPFDGHRQVTPTLGAGYLQAYASRHSDNRVIVHDENFEADLDGSLRRNLAMVSPDAVGISFPSSAVRRVQAVARLVKEEAPRTPVFAGGYHPTAEPEYTLRLLPDLDFVVRGEGESFIVDFSGDWCAAAGTSWLRDGGYACNPVRLVEDLDTIPHPDRTLFDPRYFAPQHGVIAGIFGRTATLMSSRGCPYGCTFCSCRSIQSKVRYHGTEYVLAEIEHILNTLPGLDYLYFIDVMFLAHWPRVEALCDALRRHGLHKRLRWAATVSANVLTRDKARAMKEAGCFYLSFGFESHSGHVLKLMNKRATPEDNVHACDICAELELFANSAFLFGTPGEREEDLQATVSFVRDHDVAFTGVNVVRPLPGSPLYETLVATGQICRSVDDWERVASIYDSSFIPNQEVSAETYRRYIEQFNAVIRSRARRHARAANWRKKLKYALGR